MNNSTVSENKNINAASKDYSKNEVETNNYSEDCIILINELLAKLGVIYSKLRDILREYNQSQQRNTFEIQKTSFDTKIESIDKEFQAKNLQAILGIVSGAVNVTSSAVAIGMNINAFKEIKANDGLLKTKIADKEAEISGLQGQDQNQIKDLKNEIQSFKNEFSQTNNAIMSQVTTRTHVLTGVSGGLGKVGESIAGTVAAHDMAESQEKSALAEYQHGLAEQNRKRSDAIIEQAVKTSSDLREVTNMLVSAYDKITASMKMN